MVSKKNNQQQSDDLDYVGRRDKARHHLTWIARLAQIAYYTFRIIQEYFS